MTAIRVCVDDNTKVAIDSLFSSLWLDTLTPVRIFLTASLDCDGIPFVVRRRIPKTDLMEVIEDTRLRC